MTTTASGMPEEVWARAFEAADNLYGELRQVNAVRAAAEVAYAAGRADERARVVAWLRSGIWVYERFVRGIGARIERGEHLDD